MYLNSRYQQFLNVSISPDLFLRAPSQNIQFHLDLSHILLLCNRKKESLFLCPRRNCVKTGRKKMLEAEAQLVLNTHVLCMLFLCYTYTHTPSLQNLAVPLGFPYEGAHYNAFLFFLLPSLKIGRA